MTRPQPTIVVDKALCEEKAPEPGVVVIFGASGDLTRRKLLPALFRLFTRGLLPSDFTILGCARTRMTDEAFRNLAREAIHSQLLPSPLEGLSRQSSEGAEPEEGGGLPRQSPAESGAKTGEGGTLAAFLKRCGYLSGDYANPALYKDLNKRLALCDQSCGKKCNRLFYLATPPDLYRPIVEQLDRSGLAQKTGGERPWSHVVVEKPFGRDLESAKALNSALLRFLAEKQIYRIDHYLGKETVQNLLMFRFGNAIFESLWNRACVDHVQITVAETLGVEHRAGYYERAGLLRDVFQNHMLQVLALAAMEPPSSLDADAVRDEKARLLRSVRPFPAKEMERVIVRGQYGAGRVEGKKVPAYREEEGVAPDSTVETFAAAKLFIDNERWQGVPFCLRSGKRLGKRISEIAVVFKKPANALFAPLAGTAHVPNVLSLNVQPEEGIALSFLAKSPGPKFCIAALSMDFSYREVFQAGMPDAYERLLLDCMLGDATLFTRQDAMELSWSLLDPVFDAWENGRGGDLYPYASGSWGPTASDALIETDGREWRNL